MNILLTPLGSGGDVLPFIRLGMALKARGHDVTVITMGRYEPLARHAGLAFVEWISPEAMQAVEDNPDLWHPTKGLVLAIRAVEPWYRPLHEHIQARYVPGQTVLVAGALNLGARLAHDRLGVPLATLLLQPAFLRSVHRSPVVPGLPTPDWRRGYGSVSSTSSATLWCWTAWRRRRSTPCGRSWDCRRSTASWGVGGSRRSG